MCPAVGGAGFAAGDFVGQDELEELGVTEAAGGGEGESFGEGVEAAAELHSAQQRLQLRGDGGGAHRAAPAVSIWKPASRIACEQRSGFGVASGCGRFGPPTAKWTGSRANRPGVTVPGSAG